MSSRSERWWKGQVVVCAGLLACGGQPGATTGGETSGTSTGEPATTLEGTSAAETSAALTTADLSLSGTSSVTTLEEVTTAAESSSSAAVATDDTAGSSTGTPALGCADLPLCDDFEAAAPGGPPDPALWTVGAANCSGTGALAIAEGVAHSGTRSVRVDGQGGYCNHIFFSTDAAIADIGDVLWVRFYLRLESALEDGHVTFAALQDQADGGKALRMGGQSKILMWNRESDDATLPALSPAGISESLAPTPGAWSCVEFRVDGPAGELSTYVDGAEVAGLRVDAEPTPDIDQQWKQKAWAPDLVDLQLGWESYAGQAMVLYIDDVAAASERVGCD